jgi:hypothetical protein
MLVGWVTLMVIMLLLQGGTAALAPALVVWLVVLAVGVVLSAPFFLAPPDSTGGGWQFSLPVFLWLFLIVIRLISGTGWLILRGVWFLIFLAWHRPAAVAAPQVAAAPVGGPPTSFPAPVPGQPAVPRYPPPVGPTGGLQPAPPSWQNDPTGRFRQRYWDGRAWTAHVANGAVPGMDPI